MVPECRAEQMVVPAEGSTCALTGTIQHCMHSHIATQGPKNEPTATCEQSYNKCLCVCAVACCGCLLIRKAAYIGPT
eukprot:15475099-Alexandrium_andersonii.AAC.1